MDTINSQIKKYYPLGIKTFILLILKRAVILLLFLLIWAGFFVLKSLVPNFSGIIDQVINVGALVIVVIAVLVIFIASFEYMHYAVVIDQNDFKVLRGIISQTEFGVPYKRIKDVVIKRSIIDEILGVSKIVITVLGEEAGQAFSEESVISLSLIKKDTAQGIQDQILNRVGPV